MKSRILNTKKQILEPVIYKLILIYNNAKYFHWIPRRNYCISIKSFFQTYVPLNSILMLWHKFTNICQNITNLEINECDKDTIGLASFIETQKNLQSSLSLHFDNVEGQYTLLNNIIRKKAATLKKVTIQPIITLISPIFIPSLLKNIQYLALIILIMNMVTYMKV